MKIYKCPKCAMIRGVKDNVKICICPACQIEMEEVKKENRKVFKPLSHNISNATK